MSLAAVAGRGLTAEAGVGMYVQTCLESAALLETSAP